jgi:hypothetical protein
VFPAALPQDGIVSGPCTEVAPAREKKAMKKTLITIAFAAASLPMFAAHQATPAVPPANQPAKTEAKPAMKTKKVHKKVTKKSTEKKATPAATPAPVGK